MGCNGDTGQWFVFFGERQELCRKLWLISDERPRIDWDRLRFNLEPSKKNCVRYVE